MEYYGYAERSADSQVDWSAISKSMSDMLTEKNKIREDKKAALDQASRDASNHLVDVPLGQHVGANEFALRFTDNASKYQLMQDRLLKQGALGLKEYTVARQNLLDDTDKTFKMLGNFKTQADEIMARTDAGENQKLELEQMSRISDWGNLDQSDLYINPTTGSMTIGRVTTQTIDGKTVRTMTKNPKEFTTISNANATMYERHNKFNLNTPVDNIVDKMGDQLDVLRNYGSETRAGNIISVLDVTRKTGATDKNGVVQSFLKMEDNAIEGILSNKYDRLSLLTENIATKNGLPYRFVYTPEEAKGHPEAIYMETQAGSGKTVPVLSEEQMYDSTEYLRSQMRLRYDKKTTMNPYNEPTKPRPSQAEIDAGNANEKLKDNANYIGALYSGDDTTIKSASGYFGGQSNILQVNRTPQGVSITTKDGVQKDFPFYSGTKLLPKAEWVRSISSALAGDDANVKTIVQNSLLKGTTFNSKANASSKAKNVEEKYTDYINTASTEDATKAMALDKSEAAVNLSALYSKLGFSFKDVGYTWNDDVLIKAPKTDKGKAGPSITIQTNGSPEQNAKQLERLKNFMTANASKDKIEEMNKKGLLSGASATPEQTPTEGKVDEYGVPIK